MTWTFLTSVDHCHDVRGCDDSDLSNCAATHDNNWQPLLRVTSTMLAMNAFINERPEGMATSVESTTHVWGRSHMINVVSWTATGTHTITPSGHQLRHYGNVPLAYLTKFSMCPKSANSPRRGFACTRIMLYASRFAFESIKVPLTPTWLITTLPNLRQSAMRCFKLGISLVCG